MVAAAVLLFAAAICHAGIAALPGGVPVLNGLPLRPWREAIDSTPAPLLTVAGFGAAAAASTEGVTVGVGLTIAGVALELGGDEIPAPVVRV